MRGYDLFEATYSAVSTERLYVHVLIPRDGMRWLPATEALFLPTTHSSLPVFVSPPMPAKVRDDPHERPNEYEYHYHYHYHYYYY